MAKCPRCGSEVDAEFSTHCPDCGESLHADVPDLRDQTVDSSEPSSSTLPPPPSYPTASGNKSAWLSRGITVVALGAVAGTSIFGFLNSAKRDDTGEISKPGTILISDMRVGDCADLPSAATDDVEDVYSFDELKAQPCSVAHDFEMYAILSYPASSSDPFPGNETVTNWGANACYEEFERYTGIAYEDSPDLDFDLFWPTPEGWEEGDREVNCILIGYNPEDLTDYPKLIGSKKAVTD